MEENPSRRNTTKGFSLRRAASLPLIKRGELLYVPRKLSVKIRPVGSLRDALVELISDESKAALMEISQRNT
jgi:hypothetical protein